MCVYIYLCVWGGVCAEKIEDGYQGKEREENKKAKTAAFKQRGRERAEREREGREKQAQKK